MRELKELEMKEVAGGFGLKEDENQPIWITEGLNEQPIEVRAKPAPGRPNKPIEKTS